MDQNAESLYACGFSAFVLSVTAGLFYLNRRPAENIDDVTLLTLFKK